MTYDFKEQYKSEQLAVKNIAKGNFKEVIHPTTTEKKDPKWEPISGYSQPEIVDPNYVSKKSIYNSLLSQPGQSVSWNILKIRSSNSLEAIAIPGIAKLTVTFSKRIKKVDQAGNDWQKLNDEGMNCKLISAKIQMSAMDYATYNRKIVPILQVKSFAGKPINIVRLSNPLLDDYGIDEVMIESITQSTPEVGMVEVAFEFIEYHEPEAKLGTKGFKPSKYAGKASDLSQPVAGTSGNDNRI